MKKMLFKAKRIDNKEWIEGIPFYVAEKWVMLINHDENAVRPPYVAGSMCEAEIYCREIDPETICQYTGFKDKNGAEIFGGDILSTRLNEIYEAWWNSDTAAFTLSGNNESKGFEYLHKQEFEIVGNVFDHAELLEGDD